MAAADDKNVRDAPTTTVKKLEAAIGKENVKTSKMERLLYSHEGSAPLPNIAQLGFMNVPDIVTRPTSTSDVQHIVKIANEDGIPIVPRGASSWGMGGSMPIFGGIIIDMTGKMNKIIEIDVDNLCCTVEAGASYKSVYEACLAKGLLLGSYPSSFPNASIGGWLAKDGVGIGSYKYGGPGNNLRSLEVVMPDGSICKTGFDHVVDNSAGYNVSALQVGAEGTLGVICKVTLKLHPFGGTLKNVAYSFGRLQDLSKPLWELCRSQVIPLHIGFSDGRHFEFLRKAGKHVPEVGTILNIAFEGSKENVERDEAAVDAIIAKHGGKKMTPETGQHEWDERCYEYRAREVGLDSVPGEVVVRLKDFEAMTNRCYELIDQLKMDGAIIGIMCDRNTVMFMPYYFLDSTSFLQMTSFAFSKKVGDISMEYGGRGLGFGALFSSNLVVIRGKDNARQMKAIKMALDKNEVMNPGKLLEMQTRYGIGVSPKLFGLVMDGMTLAKKALPIQGEFDRKADDYEDERKKKGLGGHQH